MQRKKERERIKRVWDRLHDYFFWICVISFYSYLDFAFGALPILEYPRDSQYPSYT